MNEPLQNDFYEKYPSLFSHDNKISLECGNGWYALLDGLCFTISQHQSKLDEANRIKLKQIKEKFGGLRVYYDGGDNYIAGAVDMAEKMSYYTCEVCGNQGEPNTTGWISTLCEWHREDKLKSYDQN
jgi:hypothetical protein